MPAFILLVFELQTGWLLLSLRSWALGHVVLRKALEDRALITELPSYAD